MSDELLRLRRGPDPGEMPVGMGLVTFDARCSGEASTVLDKVKQILDTVLSLSRDPWPSDEEWSQLLPAWLVESFVPERSREELEEWLQRWRSLPPEEKGAAAQAAGWSLGDWIYWFQPEERQWSWWSAAVLDPDLLQIRVQAQDWPFPSEAFEWLIKAAGADSVEKGAG